MARIWHDPESFSPVASIAPRAAHRLVTVTSHKVVGYEVGQAEHVPRNPVATGLGHHPLQISRPHHSVSRCRIASCAVQQRQQGGAGDQREGDTPLFSRRYRARPRRLRRRTASLPRSDQSFFDIKRVFEHLMSSLPWRRSPGHRAATRVLAAATARSAILGAGDPLVPGRPAHAAVVQYGQGPWVVSNIARQFLHSMASWSPRSCWPS